MGASVLSAENRLGQSVPSALPLRQSDDVLWHCVVSVNGSVGLEALVLGESVGSSGGDRVFSQNCHFCIKLYLKPHEVRIPCVSKLVLLL